MQMGYSEGERRLLKRNPMTSSPLSSLPARCPLLSNAEAVCGPDPSGGVV